MPAALVVTGACRRRGWQGLRRAVRHGSVHQRPFSRAGSLLLQVTQWPAMKKWSRPYLKKAFKDGMVRWRGVRSSGAGRCRVWGPGAGQCCVGRCCHRLRAACLELASLSLPNPMAGMAATSGPDPPPLQVLVGDQPIPFDSYCAYADTNTDELPLYL